MTNPMLRRFSRISVLHLILKMILTKTISGTNYMFSENKDFRNSQPLAPSKLAIEIISISKCAQICMRNNDICLTYGYNHKSRVCALFEEYLSTPSQVFEDGWNYFLKSKDCSEGKDTCGDYSYRGNTCRCLKFMDIQVNASAAKDVCNNHGGWLPRISNQLLNSDLKEFSMRFNVPESVFIQGHRRLSDNEYYFDDEGKMVFFDWSPSQPQERTNEEVIIAVGISFGDRAWHDYNEDNILSVVCEKLPQ